MSEPANLNLTPLEPLSPRPFPVEAPGPPHLAPEKPGRAWRPLVTVVVVLLVAAGVWTARRRQQVAATGVAAVRTVKVLSGPFERSLRVSGTITASSFAPIVAPLLSGEGRGVNTAPWMQLGALLQMAPPGSVVKKGDVIAQFDGQGEMDHLDDHKARLIQAEAVVDKRKAEVTIENEVLRQTLRAARAEHEKARLDLRTAEVRSAIDGEKLKLMVEETAARHKQFEAEVRLRATSQQAEIRGLEIQVEQENHGIERHSRNIQRRTMLAPIGGLIVMQSIFRSGQFGQVQAGDQVNPGTYFMQIVDLSKMVLNASANQADSHLVTLGQRAVVRLDAYPGLALPGRVIAVGAMATSGGRMRNARELYVKQIAVRVAIESKDARILPDLSGSAAVQLEKIDQALQIPNEALTEEAGKAYVQVRAGDAFEQRAVQLGPRNRTHQVILAGLSETDEVALP